MDRAPSPKDGVTAWLLERYLVPAEFLSDGAWLYDYLRRRHEAASSANDALDAFIPIAPPNELERAWIISAPEPKAERYIPQRQRELAQLARGRADLVAERRLALPPSCNSAAQTPGDGCASGHGRKYFLLNDTAAIDGHQHLGCSSVTSYIHYRLQCFGLECAGVASDKKDAQRLILGSERDDVDLVIFNGEGSVHHDASRIAELVEFCAFMKAEWKTYCADKYSLAGEQHRARKISPYV